MLRRTVVPALALLCVSVLSAQSTQPGQPSQSSQPSRDTPAQKDAPPAPSGKIKGRVLAVALLAGYHYAFSVSTTAGFVMMGVLALVMPVLTWKSLQFKLHNASYRGIRFGFDGSLGEAYAHYLLLPLLFGTGLLAPLAHNRIKRCGSVKGSGRNMTVFATVKMALLAPIPSAKVTAATIVKPGARRSVRTP